MPFPAPETVIAAAESLLRLIAVCDAHDGSRPGSPLRRQRDEVRQRAQAIINRNRQLSG